MSHLSEDGSLVLGFDKRIIVQCHIPMESKDHKFLYKKAAYRLAEHLISNNAIRGGSEFLPNSEYKKLYFWMQTYEKPIDWSKL